MKNEIFNLLIANADAEQSKKMSQYMQNKFAFAGIPRPKLKLIVSDFLKTTSKEPIDWNLIFELWFCDYREAQYIALDYMYRHRKQILPGDLENLKKLITSKSWWDTVDSLDSYIGNIVLMDDSIKNIMLEWAADDNIWLRRVAINFQQQYKALTDADLLSSIIKINFNSNEFFIDKAIGWSLREYSKTNPEWVAEFVDENINEMSKLSIKEASLYLKNRN